MATQKRKAKRVSNCNKKTPTGTCPGKYILSYENNAPIFTCEKCGDKNIYWYKFYNEYLQLFRTKSNWDEKKHQVSCIIGFFCHMYKEKYGTDYIFVPKNPNPYSSKECKDALSLLSAFSGRAHEARKYLYWLFKHGINNTTDITSFGYVNTPALIRKYILQARKKNILTRSSKLPKRFIDWCHVEAPKVFADYSLETMNDLGALLSYIEHYGNDNTYTIERAVLSKATSMGLIKNGRLNIGSAT